MKLVNGDPSQSLSYIYQVTAKRALAPGVYYLPEGKLEINGNTYAVDKLEVSIVLTSKAVRRGPVDFAQLIENLSPYEGEQLTYRSEIVSSTDITDAILEEIALPEFFREEFPEQKQIVRRVSNSRVFSIREAIYPKHTGELIIPPRSLNAKVRVQAEEQHWGEFFDDIWGDVFDNFSYKQARFTAPALKLQVKPLPQKPKGVTGYIPTGKTSVIMNLDRTELKAGETALLEVVVESEGHLKPLDFDFAKIVSGDVKFYPDKADTEKVLKGDRLFQRKTFHAAIVPEYGGSYKVAGPEVYFFDPHSGAYQVSRAESISLLVSGSARPKTTEPTPEVKDKLPNVDVVSPVNRGKETQLVFSPPPSLLSKIHLSRRVFFGLLLLILFFSSATALLKAPPSTAKQADLSDLLPTLRGQNWTLKETDIAALKSLVEASEVKERGRLRELLERVEYGPQALRLEAEQELTNFLKGYQA
jgi:hypothetical protein